MICEISVELLLILYSKLVFNIFVFYRHLIPCILKNSKRVIQTKKIISYVLISTIYLEVIKVKLHKKYSPQYLTGYFAVNL